MEYAQNTLNHLLANREDVRQKVEVSGWGHGAEGCPPAPLRVLEGLGGAEGVLGMLDLAWDVGVSLGCPEREQSWGLSCPHPLLCPFISVLPPPGFIQVKTDRVTLFEWDWLWTNSSWSQGRHRASQAESCVTLQSHT